MMVSGKLERILMTVDTVGGVWNYAMELVKGLGKRGVEIILASMGPLPDNNKRKEVAGFKNVQLYESSFKLEWMDDPWDEVEGASEWLLELEIMNHPDLIHLNNFVHGDLPWHSPVIIVGHSCVCSWFKVVEKMNIPSYLSSYKENVNKGLQCADCLVTPSEWMMKMMHDVYGNFKRTQVIYNGRSINDIKQYSKDKIIFAAGRIWDKAKNLKMLMSLAGELHWPLFIAGDDRNECQSYINVNWLGVLNNNEMCKWMERTSIFVSPSLYEPFGLSILEAAICKCALVLADIESLREIWNGAALFVKPEDKNSFKNTINDLIKDEKMLIEYADRANKRALQYSSENMVNSYMKLYENIIINFSK